MNLHHIENETVSAVSSTRLVRAIRNGEIQREQYLAYLSDVYLYARCSSQVIGIAGTRLALSHPELASYLYAHAAEELGHDRWAAQDLKELGLSEGQIFYLQPSAPCRYMVALEYYYAVHENPVGLFGWMFTLESLGGKLGGNVASALDRALELNGRALSFLRGHGEADVHHASDLNRVIEAHITEEKDWIAFSAMANDARELYCGILDSAYEQHARQAA